MPPTPPAPAIVIPHALLLLSAAIHHSTTTPTLTALFGSLHALFLSIFLPPVIHTLAATLTLFNILPSALIAIPAAAVLPAVHVAVYPLVDYTLLILILSSISIFSFRTSPSNSVTPFWLQHVSAARGKDVSASSLKNHFLFAFLINAAFLQCGGIIARLRDAILPYSASTDYVPHAVAASTASILFSRSVSLRTLLSTLQHSAARLASTTATPFPSPSSPTVARRSKQPRTRRRRARSAADSNVPTDVSQDFSDDNDVTHPTNARTPPSKFAAALVSIVIPFLVTFSLTMCATPPLARTLHSAGAHTRRLPAGYFIRSQGRGATGLVSVVEQRRHHRMLTADRSVLGGYFIMPGHHRDSIFAQFYVHGAVRLTVGAVRRRLRGGGGERGLCVGVGVGVVARGLRGDGVVVDAVDIDGVVAKAAREWFELPKPGVIVEDARVFVSRVMATRNRSQDGGEGEGDEGAKAKGYDYVVHDVFTGGGIAPALVSTAELSALREVLRGEGGTMVVNVVSGNGGISLRVAAIVYRRLRRVFGRHVRAFAEGRHWGGGDGNDGDEWGISNIVMFASSSEDGVRFAFSPGGQAWGEDGMGGEVAAEVAREVEGMGTMRREILRRFERFEIEGGRLLGAGEDGDGNGGGLVGDMVRGWGWLAAAVEEVELRVALMVVAWRHAKVMDEVHPPKLWPALLAASARLRR